MQIRSIDAWLGVVVGLGWLAAAGDGGLLRAIFVGSTGTLLASMGVAALLIPGDLRIPAYAAFASVVGLLGSVLGVFGLGLGTAIGLATGAAIGGVAAGRLSQAWAATTPGVPAEEDSLVVAAKVAADEAVLGSFHLRLRFPTGSELERVIDEAFELRARHADLGHFEKPLAYHAAPLPLEAPRIDTRRVLGFEYEHLQFESEWEPAPEEPGRERWLRFTANRTAHAYVVRGNPDSPWLVAINGYRMGMALTDLALFDPRYYHARLGLNMLIPVLPLHGPRRAGLFSGDGYLDADPVVFSFAEAQAMWDIRRLIGWARDQGASRIGTMGLSLGGYNAALLASIEDGLACAISGIPVVDFSRILAHHGSPQLCRELDELGMDSGVLFEMLQPVSPLVLEPKVPMAGRAIFGGVADRVVPPEHQRDLIAHWGSPRHAWYQGGHVTFRSDAGVRSLIHDVLSENLLTTS